MKKSSRCHHGGFILEGYKQYRYTKHGGSHHDVLYRNLCSSRSTRIAVWNVAARQPVTLAVWGEHLKALARRHLGFIGA